MAALPYSDFSAVQLKNGSVSQLPDSMPSVSYFTVSSHIWSILPICSYCMNTTSKAAEEPAADKEKKPW